MSSILLWKPSFSSEGHLVTAIVVANSYGPSGALQSVIVGCEADYDAIYEAVREHALDLPVRRARLPNR